MRSVPSPEHTRLTEWGAIKAHGHIRAPWTVVTGEASAAPILKSGNAERNIKFYCIL